MINRLALSTRQVHARKMVNFKPHRFTSSLSFATVDPDTMSASKPHTVLNHVGGSWVLPSSGTSPIVDPLNGATFMNVADTQSSDLAPFIEALHAVPKHGLHNPFKNNERYLLYGDISHRASSLMRQKPVEDFFTKLIQRVAPKSDAQARGEYVVTRKFLENFCGDQVRFLARSFAVPGDHEGQVSSGHRWPYGPVALITPFNFPLEIPLLQLMGALYMGNKVVLKGDSKNSVVMEQMLKLLQHCGLPPGDVDFLNASDGTVMHELLLKASPRMTLFTGSSKVAELLAKDLHGRIKLEDAGFDWKVLGPDVGDVDYVAWQSDQDAYAYSGQKCSAQSIMFMHENWTKQGTDVEAKLKALAARRTLDDLTVGPVLSVTTETMEAHRDALLQLPGARVAFGGGRLQGGDHSIPACYGAWDPCAVHVPLSSMLASKEAFELCTTEIFGPFQVLTTYGDGELGLVLEALERMEHHLTAAIVSNDVQFQNKVLGSTVNGTTYVGRRARTTGAPQNHWFGPAGDPRGAGIGTPEAIQLVWSCHREAIRDEGPIPAGWATPPPS